MRRPQPSFSPSCRSRRFPTADRKGSKDSPLLKRYEGSFIVAYERKSFGELTLPLSPIELVTPEKRTQQNNRVFEPKKKKALEGVYTRLAYLLPAERSPLEVLRNYQDEIKSKGGKVLFECKGTECGGRPGAQHRRRRRQHEPCRCISIPPERVIDPHGSNGWCALSERITDQRYTAAELPQSGAHVSVHRLHHRLARCRDPCLGFNGRTIAVVDIVEAKDREKKMVTVDAGEMAKSIDSTGRVALYGIYFDFNKADVKPESDATLEQIAALMKTERRAEAAGRRPYRQRRQLLVQHGFVATPRRGRRRSARRRALPSGRTA